MKTMTLRRVVPLDLELVVGDDGGIVLSLGTSEQTGTALLSLAGHWRTEAETLEAIDGGSAGLAERAKTLRSCAAELDDLLTNETELGVAP
jgi:hypothetical protein